MNKIKILLLILSFFIMADILNANECLNNIETSFSANENKLVYQSFNIGSNSLIDKAVKYKWSEGQKAQLFFGIFIAGIVVGGIGTLMIIPGAVLMGVSYNNAPFHTPWAMRPVDFHYNLWFSGIALIASGSALFVIGITGIILGLIIYKRFGGKIVLNTETDIKAKALKTSLSFKF